MLAISSSPLMSSTNNGEDQMGGALLDVDISFDDLFVGFDDGDILPDLEIDSDDIFADFSFSSGEEDTSAVAVAVAVLDSSQVIADSSDGNVAETNYSYNKVEDKDEEDLSRHNDEVDISATCKEEDGKSAASASASGGEKIRSGRKTSTCKGSHGKKKAKVDWTPELHRRFVQAVEQLGVDKAVPSRILELMGIDCLTRHNIASHLQKYRCHRKHLLARETEAASWSQRRQMYSGGIMKRAAMARPNILGLGLGLGLMKNINPTTPCKNILGNCFPPPPPPPPHHHHHHHQMQMQMPMPSGAALIRPLHVWGHPPSMQVDRPQLVPLWPRHLSPPPWIPLRPNINGPPIPDPMTYWPPPLSHSHKALAQGTPCYPPQLVPTMRFQAPPIPPHALFRPSQSQISSGGGATTVNSHYSSNSQPHHLDTHPSNEKIDAAIEDVLAKPWSPLPLGLKPPSLESVMVELQRQGVSNVPPTYSSG